MINKKHFFKTNNVGFMLGAVLLAALANNVSSADGQTVGITVTPSVVVAPAVVVQDNYVYYPSYGIYFNSSQNQYAYLNNGAWVTTPAPYGVSADVLLASPSVRMDWHDSPEKHHAEMLHRYPKDWKSSDEHHDQNADRKAGAPDGDKRTPGQTRPQTIDIAELSVGLPGKIPGQIVAVSPNSSRSGKAPGSTFSSWPLFPLGHNTIHHRAGQNETDC